MLVLGASLALTGCSGLLGGGGTGDSGGTGGNGQSGAGSNESPTADADPPAEVEGYEGVPTSFPGDVPIIDGDVPFGVDLGTGWTVIVATDDTTKAYQDAEAGLTGAGFTSQLSSTTADGSFGVFENDKYTIQLTGANNNQYGPSVTYLVVLKG